MSEFESIAEFKLESQPDCIRLFPFENPSDPGLVGSFAVCCYRYDSVNHSRDGCLLFFNPSNYLNYILSGDSLAQKPEIYYFGHDLGGFLSCFWSKFDQGYGISCISSECKLAQYYIGSSCSNSSEPNGHKINISKKSEIKLLEQDSLPIPLSLSTFDDLSSSMCVTCSGGECFLVRSSEVIKFQASTYQTWTSTFHPENPNLILTGSDDCSIKLFDVRSGFDPVSSQRSHTSGVTTIQFLPQSTNLFYSGGFDNCLYKFDFRNLSSFLEHHRFKTPIWYLDFVKSQDGTLESLHISGCQDGSALYDTSGNLISLFKPQNCLMYSTSHIKLSSTLFCSCDFNNHTIHFYH